MVDQAPLNSTNGRGESPPRAVARGAAELVHDLLTLAELQGKLLVVDCQSGLRKLIAPVSCLAVGAVLALCCVPLALATIGLAIAESTRLSYAQSFGIVLAGALLVALVLLTGAILYLRQNWTLLDRSWTELGSNLQWSKEMLRRLFRGRSRSASEETMPQAFD